MIKCAEQAELFNWLSKVVTGTGNFVYSTGQLVNDYLGEDYMRMHHEEADSLKELFTLRENVKNQHIRQEKTLLEKKEKLFKVGDLSKWGGGGSHSCFKDEQEMSDLRNKLMQNKNMAYTYMLPKETYEWEIKREELCFLTNQCLNEVQRTAGENGKVLRQHFRDMALNMCNQINQVSLAFF